MLKIRRKKITDLGYFDNYQCKTCIKKCPDAVKGYECFALVDFYFITGDKKCISYNGDPKQWADELRYLMDHAHTNREYHEYEREYNRIQRILQIMDQGPYKYEGLSEVIHEETHKKLLKPPSGEKGERTHKKMKQNPILFHFDPNGF